VWNFAAVSSIARHPSDCTSAATPSLICSCNAASLSCPPVVLVVLLVVLLVCVLVLIGASLSRPPKRVRVGRCPPALRAVGSPLRRKAARRGRSGSPGQGGKPKKLPAQRLRKDLGRPCPGRSGPASSGGQPESDGAGRRPSTSVPQGPRCAGCRAGLVSCSACFPARSLRRVRLGCPHPAGGCCVRAGPGAGRGRSGLGLGCRRARLVSCGRCGATAPAHWRRRGTTAAPCPSRWRAAAGRRRRVRRPGEAGRCRPVAVSERRPTRPAQWSRSSRPRLGPAPDSGARPRSPAAVGAADRPQRRPGPR